MSFSGAKVQQINEKLKIKGEILKKNLCNSK